MVTSITAIFEGGILRPTSQLALAEGTRVELIIVNGPIAGGEQRPAATILAEIAALPTSGGDPRTGQNHDKVLYGEEGAR